MRCIECEEIELARVRDQRPGQTLPIPNAALDGFPMGRERTDLTRRRLLQWGVAGMASVYSAKELVWGDVWESVAEAAEAPPGKALVLLYLAGGNDGLNVVLPNGAGDSAAMANYSAYATARQNIGRIVGTSTATQVGSRALTGSGQATQLAFTNTVVSTAGGGDNGDANYGFDKLYGDGSGGAGSDLAVMPAVDALKYSLSHFDNSDIWFEASYDLNNKTGWLGRWIDRNGSATNPLQAVSIDSALSKSIRTSVNPVCAISSLPMGGFTMNASNFGGSNGVNLNPAIKDLAGAAAGAENAYLGRSRGTYGLAYSTYEATKTLGAPPANPNYPNTGTLSSRLRTAAHLLAANLGTRVITIHWGGFDTHTNQLKSQDAQLKELSRALGAFQADLKARGIADNVATLVFSEFGRRVKETPNSAVNVQDAGTDHGAGGLMLALGTQVKGGLASEWPGCKPADLVPANNPGQGNLKVPTDFRSVYLSVIADWLGDQDPVGLIGGGAVAPLVRGDGKTGLFK